MTVKCLSKSKESLECWGGCVSVIIWIEDNNGIMEKFGTGEYFLNLPKVGFISWEKWIIWNLRCFNWKKETITNWNFLEPENIFWTCLRWVSCLAGYGFFGEPGVRGARLVGSWSLVSRSLLIRDRESVLWLKFGFGLFGVLSVDQRLWGGGSWLIFRIVAQLRWCRRSVSFRGGYFWAE